MIMRRNVYLPTPDSIRTASAVPYEETPTDHARTRTHRACWSSMFESRFAPCCVFPTGRQQSSTFSTPRPSFVRMTKNLTCLLQSIYFLPFPLFYVHRSNRNSYPHKQGPHLPSPSPSGMSRSRRLLIPNFLQPSRRRSSSPVSLQISRNAQGADGGKGVRGGGGGDGQGLGGGSGEWGQCSRSSALGAKVTTTPTSTQAATKGEDWTNDETDAADGNGHENNGHRKRSSGCGDASRLGGGGAGEGWETGEAGEVGGEGARAGDSISVSAAPPLRRCSNHQFDTSRRYSFKDGLEFDLPLIRYGLERGRISGRCVLVRDRGGAGGLGGGFRGTVGGDSGSERSGSIRKAAMNKDATSTTRKSKRFFFKGRRTGDGEVKEESKDGYVRGREEDGRSRERWWRR